MQPYQPPRRANPAPPPAPPYAPPIQQQPQPRMENGISEDAESWITKHPIMFLGLSGLITASIGAVVTHYIGTYLRGREERAMMRGELAEAEALGEEAVVVPNPEPDIFDRMDGIETRLSDMAQHFGLGSR